MKKCQKYSKRSTNTAASHSQRKGGQNEEGGARKHWQNRLLGEILLLDLCK